MAEVPVTLSGVLFDKTNRTQQLVTFMGLASLTGVGVGGGPIIPPDEGQKPPLGFWGPPDMPPGFWGGGMGPGVKPQPHPEHPIVIPPGQVPQPPQSLPPGTTTPVEGNFPVQPIQPPPYIVVNYPGVGPIYVTAPEHPDQPTPQG